MPVALVHFGWYFDDAHRARAEVSRPLERVGQRRAVRRRIPFDENQFRRDVVPPRVGEPAVQENLRAAQKVSAVVVIASGDHQRKVGLAR